MKFCITLDVENKAVAYVVLNKLNIACRKLNASIDIVDLEGKKEQVKECKYFLKDRKQREKNIASRKERFKDKLAEMSDEELKNFAIKKGFKVLDRESRKNIVSKITNQINS